MYFPYLRGRQFELIALRELLEGKRISEKVIPIIEPVKPSSTLLKTLETFVKNDREIAVVFNPTVGDFAKKLKEMREEDSKVANELMTKLANQIPDEALKVVYQKLILFVSDYEITPRNTEIVPYEGYLPECYEIYFATRKIEGLSIRSLELYNMVLRDFFFQVNKRLTEITTNDIRVYLYQTQETRKISNATLDNRRVIIHTFLEWAANEGYIGSNPCRNIKAIKYERAQRKPLSGMELERVRNACETLRDKAMIEMLYSTGCRVTELERLNITDVDFEQKDVHLFGKGDKHRTSCLNVRAELALKNYLATRNDDNPALFVSERAPHGRLQKPAIEKRVRQLGEMSKIGRRVYPHLIRHTTATDGLDRGMPIEEVQQFLGHVNINTTMVYAQVSRANLKRDHRRYIV